MLYLILLHLVEQMRQLLQKYNLFAYAKKISRPHWLINFLALQCNYVFIYHTANRLKSIGLSATHPTTSRIGYSPV
jgi:hypothetical protein